MCMFNFLRFLDVLRKLKSCVRERACLEIIKYGTNLWNLRFRVCNVRTYAICQGLPYGRFIEIQSNLKGKKLHRTNQDSNSLVGIFNNRDNVRTPIQYRRESQPHHLKRWFFLMNRPIHFHINNISVIRAVRWNQLSFSNIDIKKQLLTPVHSVS